jgi:hypothetical protein
MVRYEIRNTVSGEVKMTGEMTGKKANSRQEMSINTACILVLIGPSAVQSLLKKLLRGAFW